MSTHKLVEYIIEYMHPDTALYIFEDVWIMGDNFEEALKYTIDWYNLPYPVQKYFQDWLPMNIFGEDAKITFLQHYFPFLQDCLDIGYTLDDLEWLITTDFEDTNEYPYHPFILYHNTICSYLQDVRLFGKLPMLKHWKRTIHDFQNDFCIHVFETTDGNLLKLYSRFADDSADEYSYRIKRVNK